MKGSATRQPDSTSSLKGHVLSRRAEIRAMHQGGASADRVSDALVSLCDHVVRQTYLAAMEDSPAAQRQALLESLAIVAVGGYGRQDLAPYSDIDLLFLTAPHPSAKLRDLVSRLVRDLWDAGLHLSQSVRSPADCAGFARIDFAARTALFEKRLVTGDPGLFDALGKHVALPRGRRAIRAFVNQAVASRREEHEDYFSRSAFLLEPNVKKSPGGLRDVHLLRWLALVQYGTTDPSALQSMGMLSSEDAELISGGSAFLRWIRHEMHFSAGCAQDVLTREEQVRLAERMGYHPEGQLLPVEQFMQRYYRHAAGLSDLLARFIDRLDRKPITRVVIDRVLSHRVAPYIIARPGRIEIDPKADERLLSDTGLLINTFDLARRFGVPVDPHTLDRIRQAVPLGLVTLAERRQFLGCLADPAGLGTLIRDLHRVGLLERIIPALQHARGLIQFSLLHHYTIDEHCIRAVEAVTTTGDQSGPPASAYREIRRKDLLHLALLLHDLGKGLGDDHCLVGEQIATETARSFGLDEHETHLLTFLVRHHLLMAHTSQRRDPDDMHTLLQFTRAVGTPELLRMLYVMTAADTQAVAPGEFTAWKESLLTGLYSRAMEELTGETPLAEAASRCEAIRAGLRKSLAADFDADWLKTQLDLMPPSYLAGTEPQRVGAHLRVLREMGGTGVRVEPDYCHALQLARYTVLTYEALTPGIVSKIAGTLAASGFQILDARIATRSDGVVIDTFSGIDKDFSGPPPAERLKELAGRIEQVLLGQEHVESLLSRRGEPLTRQGSTVAQDPPTVEIDNTSSDRFTIIEVFAPDRIGLLYALTGAMFNLGLSVYSAKISTHYDQIVDAFYVTRTNGERIEDQGLIERIRRQLLEVL